MALQSSYHGNVVIDFKGADWARKGVSGLSVECQLGHYC